jgi:2-dehydro-3-deoxy-D-gluconate 5-dehydrogenase
VNGTERQPTPQTGSHPGALEDQVALIIGGGGLGAGLARGFSEAGATVAVADRSEDHARAAAEGAGGSATWWSADVTKELSIAQLVEAVLAEHERIDVLVNAVGITHLAPAETFPTAAFDAVMDVNVRGVFLACRAVGQHMLGRGSGAIVNISSVGGTVALTESLAYCASKGAVDQLTRTLAVEWAQRGVRVNAIAPSWIRTPILDALDGREELLAARLSGVPLGRLGEPHEVAAVAVFLCSPGASLVTGTILPADGGFLAQ